MLGDNILKLRKKLGLTQEELSEKIDVTRQTISNWELNETQLFQAIYFKPLYSNVLTSFFYLLLTFHL